MKIYQNRLTVDEVTAKSCTLRFLKHGVSTTSKVSLRYLQSA